LPPHALVSILSPTARTIPARINRSAQRESSWGLLRPRPGGLRRPADVLPDPGSAASPEFSDSAPAAEDSKPARTPRASAGFHALPDFAISIVRKCHPAFARG